jgi:hypothetical protein
MIGQWFSESMDKNRASAFFTIIVGVLMMGMWTLLVFTGQVPYLDTPQMEIKLHIFTEMLTAGALILGGLSVLWSWKRLNRLHYVSQGMLIYAIINSSGYYIDLGETAMAAMFGVLLIGTLASLLVFKQD